MLTTRRANETLRCLCGAQEFSHSVVRVINVASDPELLESLLAQRINLVSCPDCGREFLAQSSIYINDAAEQKYVCLHDEGHRAQDTQLQLAYLQELVDFALQAGKTDPAFEIPEYVRQPQMVFSISECALALGRPLMVSPWPSEEDDSWEDVSTEFAVDQDVLSPIFDEDQLDPTFNLFRSLVKDAQPRQSKSNESKKDQSRTVIHELNEDDFEQVLDAEREDGWYGALVARWKESGQNHYAFLDGDVLNLFQLHNDPKSFTQTGDLVFQLHRQETFPLIVLLLVAQNVDDSNNILYWLFNLDNQVDERFLESLSRHFEVCLHLFDHDYQLGAAFVYSQPLEQNVAYVLEQARAWLKQIEPERRNFFVAASAFDESAYQKLGDRPPSMAIDSFHDLPTAAITKLALDILTYWSSPGQYEYLIFIKSFPVERFKRILVEVLSRSIHFGLAMTDTMRRLAVELRLVNSKASLAQRLLNNFQRAVHTPGFCDLDLASVVENWQRLTEIAATSGIEIDPLIQSSIEQAQTQLVDREGIIPLDLEDDVEMLTELGQLERKELLQLLEQAEDRPEAICALAAIGDVRDIEPVIQAYVQLSKTEINKLGVCLAEFGEPIRAALEQVIQKYSGAKVVGAYRVLHQLDPTRVSESLLQEVVLGKRGIWREAAALLGHSSHPIKLLLSAFNHVDPGVRTRLVRVLAGRKEKQAFDLLAEMSKKDPVPKVCQAAASALARLEKTLSNDNAL